MFKKKQVLKIMKLRDDAFIPKYMTKGAVAFDLHAVEKYEVYNALVRVSTGIAVAIPEGYEINVRARSGLSIKHPNYLAITGGGTIDSDYRGEIVVPVVNNGHRKKEWVIEKGERIAQCVVSPIEKCKIVEVKKLDKTARGTGGFGHTGSK